MINNCVIDIQLLLLREHLPLHKVLAAFSHYQQIWWGIWYIKLWGSIYTTSECSKLAILSMLDEARMLNHAWVMMSKTLTGLCHYRVVINYALIWCLSSSVRVSKLARCYTRATDSLRDVRPMSIVGNEASLRVLLQGHVKTSRVQRCSCRVYVHSAICAMLITVHWMALLRAQLEWLRPPCTLLSRVNDWSEEGILPL